MANATASTDAAAFGQIPTAFPWGSVTGQPTTLGGYGITDSLTAATAAATYAPLASPTLTGTPTAPTQTAGDTSTKIATDAFVMAAIPAKATVAQAQAGTDNITMMTPLDTAAAITQQTTAAVNFGGLTGAQLTALRAATTTYVLNQTLTAPPGSPAVGANYIVATGGSGAWAGLDGQIVTWSGSAWTPFARPSGWQAYDANTSAEYVWTGTAWAAVGGSGGGVSMAYVDTGDANGLVAAKAYTDTKVAADLPLAGGVMSGVIAMGANKITGLANGTAATDAAAFGQIPTAFAWGSVTGRPTTLAGYGITDSLTAATAASTYIPATAYGAASGVAQLNASSKLPLATLAFPTVLY